MKDSRDPVELIRSANPVPNHDHQLEAVSSDTIFEEIMKTKTDTPTVPALRKRPRRVVLIAAALITLMATAAAAVALNSGGNLEEPAFSGENWDLIVGEGANGDSGTFKVCHQFVPADEPQTEANGLGTSGCSVWPSATQPDAVIIDALIAIRTASSVVVFVDLGTVPIATVSALLDDGSRVDVSPFTMPQSRKQFAVIELPGGTASATLQAIGNDGTILEADELVGES
jgi:hypothetical protein